MLPDFLDLYMNMAFLSRDAQAKLFYKVVEIIKEELSDKDKWAEQIELHGFLFNIIAESNRNEVIFVAGDSITNQLFAAYAEQLRNDNIILMTDLDGSMKFDETEFADSLTSHLYTLEQELKRKLTMIIFPWHALQRNFEQWQAFLNTMLEVQGKLVLYGCSKDIEVNDGFYIVNECEIARGKYIKVLQTNKAFMPDEKFQVIIGKLGALQNEIEDYVKSREKYNDIILDRHILLAQSIEDFLAEKQEKIPVSDIKYHINEVKNALLNLRYSKEKDILYLKNTLIDEVRQLKKEEECLW